jgi:hypothetical protein
LLDSFVLATALILLGGAVFLLLPREILHRLPVDDGSDSLHQDQPLVPFVAAISLGVATAFLIRKTFIDIWKNRLATDPIDSDSSVFWEGLLTDRLPMLLVCVVLLMLVVAVLTSLPKREPAA